MDKKNLELQVFERAPMNIARNGGSIRLRNEQLTAIEKTVDYFRACQADNKLAPHFLWNAKPRFGKTLAAYCFAADIRASRVLIVTNRPVVADAWYMDFVKFDFAKTDKSDGNFRWIFTCSKATKKRLNEPEGVWTRAEQMKSGALLKSNMIHFVSLQDIKGRKLNRFKRQNRWIFDLEWDLVIIDESHEGAETKQALDVFEKVRSEFYLHLSGTPFRALTSGKYSAQQVYNWSYTDEQKAKKAWKMSDGDNPYAMLPELRILTYWLPNLLRDSTNEFQNAGSEYAFDLAEFFRVVNTNGIERFAYEAKVRQFIQKLHEANSQYPFGTKNNYDSLRHTFWLLPGVKACQQLKKLLLEDEFFGKMYQPEDIVLAVGDGDDDKSAKTILDEVRKRIKKSPESRTITLSCGQLTMGVTIPEWTAIFVLSGCQSASLYTQSIFRAQSPYAMNRNGVTYHKEKCYVFDFAPERALRMVAEMARNSARISGEEEIRQLIQFLPVYGETMNGNMQRLNVSEILTIPLQITTEEVLARGCMSNRIFRNIKGVFGCPNDIKNIISKLYEVHDDGKVERDSKKKSRIDNLVRVWVDHRRLLHVNGDIAVELPEGILDGRNYVEIDSEDGRALRRMLRQAESQAKMAGYSYEMKNLVLKELQKRLPMLVEKLPRKNAKVTKESYVVRAMDSAPKAHEKTMEERLRDRLRGFARTIPSVLVAYGNDRTTLANFGENVPEDIFEELTGITKNEFAKLRDGVDEIIEHNNGIKEVVHFDGVFDEVVLNAYFQRFAQLKRSLAGYYDGIKPNIFEYVPPYTNSQIFTPHKIAVVMVDELERKNPRIFASTTNQFLDPYMKSGILIGEIVRRIFLNTRGLYESDFACVKHILENQVYGFAPTPILDRMVKSYLFGFDAKNKIRQDNFREFNAAKVVKSGGLEKAIQNFYDKGGQPMKFAAIISNPPYQEDVDGRSEQPPVYNYFCDAAFDLAERAILVVPGRFLFNAGGTPTSWNQKMLSDEHLKVVEYFADSRGVFPEVTIKGGVAVLYRDSGKAFGKIGTFAPNAEIRGILEKVRQKESGTMADIIFANTSYRYTEDFFVENPDLETRVSGGSKKYLSSSAFDKFPEVFLKEVKNKKEYAQIVGRQNNQRVSYYFARKYLRVPQNFEKYKVFLPSSSGRGRMGEILAEPFVGEPNVGATETFFSFGSFDREAEAKNLVKYLKTKFARILLGTKKVTQAMKSARVWSNVPVQDWGKISDINWQKSVAEIDRQLYEKYGLSEKEIEFIERTAKEMM